MMNIDPELAAERAALTAHLRDSNENELVARDSAGDEPPMDVDGSGGEPCDVTEPEHGEFCPECGQDHGADVEGCPLVDDPRYYPGEDMDGDAASALASAGMGTDEDYGYFGETE